MDDPGRRTGPDAGATSAAAHNAERRLRRPGPRALAHTLKQLYHYRGRLEEHQRAWLVEVATAVNTTVRARRVGRAALATYRLVVRVLAVAALMLMGLAVVLLITLGRDHWWAVALAVPPLVGGLGAGWLWFTWGAALRVLDEYADPARELALTELPGRLRDMAKTDGPAAAAVPAELLRDLLWASEEPAPPT